MPPAPGPGPPPAVSSGQSSPTSHLEELRVSVDEPLPSRQPSSGLGGKAAGRSVHKKHDKTHALAPTPSQLVHQTMHRSKKRMNTPSSPASAKPPAEGGEDTKIHDPVATEGTAVDDAFESGRGLYRYGASGAESYRSLPFASDEMRQILNLDRFDAADKLRYEPPRQFIQGASLPDWIINSQEWRNARFENKDQNVISEILRVPANHRSPEQRGSLAKWLMDVWPIASDMGFKRCVDMSEVMVYQVVDAGSYIVTEGEQGHTFFIIVSGTASVSKQVAGVVAHMSKGKCFGELALTQGADLRQASVVAETRMELLSLHRLDYDHFVRDYQLAERRENFATLRNCKLFEHWTRHKIDQMCTNAVRKVYDAGEFVFRQGDLPDKMYIVLEGTLHAVRDEAIVNSNRWPVGKNAWETVLKRSVDHQIVREMNRGDYFGELAIIKNTKRSANVIAKTRSILLLIDKLEFLHLLRHKNVIQSVVDTTETYFDVDDDEEEGGSGGGANKSPAKTAQSMYKARLKELHAKAMAEDQSANKKVVESSTFADPSRAHRPYSSSSKGKRGAGSPLRMPAAAAGGPSLLGSPDPQRPASPGDDGWHRPKLAQKSLSFMSRPATSSADARGLGAGRVRGNTSGNSNGSFINSKAQVVVEDEQDGEDRAVPLPSGRATPTASTASIIIPSSLRASSAPSLSPPPPSRAAPLSPHSRQPASPLPSHCPDDKQRSASAGLGASARTRFYDPEDLTVEPSSGELALKPLRRVPLEFGKRISERAKPTFYEVISSAGRPPSASRPASSPSSPSAVASQSALLAGVFSPVSADRRAVKLPPSAAAAEHSGFVGPSTDLHERSGGTRLASIRSEPNLLMRAASSQSRSSALLGPGRSSSSSNSRAGNAYKN